MWELLFQVLQPPDAHYEAASSVSGGITIPTATTLLGDAKVEEGVEVMSTPVEPHVGLTFDTAEAAMDFYKFDT